MHLKKVDFFPEKYPTTDCYPFNQALFHHTRRVEFDTPVTLFVGENGSGKSTLLEALANKCQIHIWRSVEGSRYEVNPYEEQLCRYIGVEWANGRVPGSFFGSDIFNHFVQSLDEWAAADPGIRAVVGEVL